MKSKILITGANGFLGTNLCSFLKENNKDFVIYEGDVANPIKSKENISCIVHLAAKSSISSCNSDPKGCINTNFLGTFNVLEYAKKINAKVIFPSSAGVYKNSDKTINENSDLDPKNYYTESKYLSERMCYYYSSSHKLNIVVLRMFNVYGLPEKKSSLVRTLLNGLKDDRFVELNSPTDVRDYIYIKDVCSAFLSAINFGIDGYHIFNIASGVGISVQDMVNKISAVSGKQLNVKYTNFRKEEIKCSVADITLARKMLKWQPKYSLEKGLEDILKQIKV